jgi:hypothetical protein
MMAIKSFKSKLEMFQYPDTCIVAGCYNKRMVSRLFCGLHLRSGEKSLRD